MGLMGVHQSLKLVAFGGPLLAVVSAVGAATITPVTEMLVQPPTPQTRTVCRESKALAALAVALVYGLGTQVQLQVQVLVLTILGVMGEQR